MAQRAENLKVEPFQPKPAPVPPLRIEKTAREKPVANIKSAAARTSRNTQARARGAYSLLINRSGALARDVGHKLQKARHERPMQIVAAVAGIGFVMGVVLRVWRSKQ